PDAGETVRHQLDLNRPGARAASREQTEQVLHVVSVLMRNHVAFGERTAPRAKSLAQLLKEADVEVHVLVCGAIERPHLRARRTAAPLDVAGEEHGLRQLVRGAPARELVRSEEHTSELQ